MIMLIDNYDSFTYNLYQYLAEMGQEVQVHRNDRISVDKVLAVSPDHIVISREPVRRPKQGSHVTSSRRQQEPYPFSASVSVTRPSDRFSAERSSGRPG